MRKLLLSLFSHRTLALFRWDLYFMHLRAKNFLTGQNFRINKDIARRSGPLFLNLGSGPRGRVDSNWLNIDGYKDVNVDYLLDFTKRWPLPDNYFDGIFCEHVFEHFSPAQGADVLRECFRVLKPGGCIRIIVPDGEIILYAYLSDRSGLLTHRAVPSGCVMESVNSYFRQGYEHQCIYDFEYLEFRLRELGFKRINKVSYGVGAASAPIILDDPAYEWESLYVEAVKPVDVDRSNHIA